MSNNYNSNRKILWRFCQILYLFLGILLFAFGIVSIIYVTFIIGLFIVLGSVSLFCISISCGNKAKNITTNNIASNATDVFSASKRPIPDGQMNYNLFDDVVDGNYLSYEYEINICLNEKAIYNVVGHGGEKVSLVQEPNNPYDSKAVAIYLNSLKIGYVYRGTTQDMVNDWIRKNELIIAYINKYSITDNKATYKIGFYKPLEMYPHKSFSLAKTKKKISEDENRYDNLISCNNGDTLIIEHDQCEECYIVYNEMSDEIGELPKSAENFIDDNNHNKIVGIFHEIEDDYGKSKYKVDVYLI